MDVRHQWPTIYVLLRSRTIQIVRAVKLDQDASAPRESSRVVANIAPIMDLIMFTGRGDQGHQTINRTFCERSEFYNEEKGEGQEKYFMMQDITGCFHNPLVK